MGKDKEKRIVSKSIKSYVKNIGVALDVGIC